MAPTPSSHSIHRPKLNNFAAVGPVTASSQPVSVLPKPTQSFPATVTRLRAETSSPSTSKTASAHSTVTKHNAAVAQKPLEASTSTSPSSAVSHSTSASPTTLLKSPATTPPGGVPLPAKTVSAIPPPLLKASPLTSAVAGSPPPSTVSATFLRSPVSATSSASIASGPKNTTGIPTSALIGVGVSLAFLVTCAIVFLISRRGKREEKRLLGEGGKWQNLDGKKGGRKGEKVVDDDESFVWGNQAYADHGGHDGSQPVVGNAGSGMTTETFDEKATYYPQHPHQGYQLSDVQPQYDNYGQQQYHQQPQHQQTVSALNQRPPSAYNSNDPYAPAIATDSLKHATPPRPVHPSQNTQYQHQQYQTNTRNLYAPDNHHAHQSSPPKSAPAAGYAAPSALLSQQQPSSQAPVRKPSYVNTNSLHPSHAVTHHPQPARSNVGGSGRSRTNTGAVTGGALSRNESEGFGSLMLRDFDQDGALLPTHAETPDLSRSINRKPVPDPYDGLLLSPSPSSQLQPQATARKPTKNDRLSANGFVPLDQMRADGGGNYRSPIESIFESYEGEEDWERNGSSPADASSRRGGEDDRSAGYLYT